VVLAVIAFAIVAAAFILVLGRNKETPPPSPKAVEQPPPGVRVLSNGVEIGSDNTPIGQCETLSLGFFKADPHSATNRKEVTAGASRCLKTVPADARARYCSVIESGRLFNRGEASPDDAVALLIIMRDACKLAE
jgi:hypothetical protein